MQNYGKATAKAIVEPYCGDRFEVRDNGVWPIDADKCAWSVKDDDDSLQWKPSCELDGPDAPDPLETPSLPIPFTVNELAAFMLDGEGVTVSSAFGPWENGPDKGILESMGILATKAREAVVGAYAAYRDAQSVVGKRDLANEIQVARVVAERKQKMFEAQELRGEYWRKLGEAKKREKADEPDISENESQERCKRAEASVTDYRERLDHAEASVVEINERLKKSRQLARADLLPWRKAMVNYLQPPKSIGLDTIKKRLAPVGAETTEQRRARWFEDYGKGERGAVQRVYERELLLNPKVDRSFIGKEIRKAKNEKAETKRGGTMYGQLVQDGKHIN